MTQKTGGASEGEFTGLSFFNDFNKSSSHKQLGLNWNTPRLQQGRGVFGGMYGAKGEGIRGVCNELNSLVITGYKSYQIPRGFFILEKKSIEAPPGTI